MDPAQGNDTLPALTARGPNDTELSLVSRTSPDKRWHPLSVPHLFSVLLSFLNEKWSGKKLSVTLQFVLCCCFSWNNTNGKRTNEFQKAEYPGYFFSQKGRKEFWRAVAKACLYIFFFTYFMHVLLHITPYCQIQNRQNSHCPQCT